ncbi:hypothetical protein HYR54_06650 [Candidatus Acetothermia bacterium]|nr:hypothetical protein [Candidatus Acetothermia bacterium]
MKENLVTIVVSVLAGLLIRFLVWGATTAWGTGQPVPAMMNSNGMMGSTINNGPGMMGSGMIGQGMMNPGQMQHMQDMMNSPEHMKMMSEHITQGQEMMNSMMGMMHQHMMVTPSDEKK